MKKLLFIGICCMMFCGCENKENKELLTGHWRYTKSPNQYEGGWGDIYRYEFKSTNEVIYFECLHMTLSDDNCSKGSAVWIGKYTLDKNVVTLSNLKIDRNDSYNYTTKLKGPSKKLIIDFDNMYLCDREKGLNCDEKYQKVSY